MTGVWVRWIPAVAVPAVIAAGAVLVPLSAGAATDLPDKSAEQVLALVAGSSTSAFSGTIEQSSDLGLPELPSMTGGSGPADADADASTALELLTGSHTLRVYVDGPTRARVQVLDNLAERDVVRNGDEVWLYDSSGSTATHLTLPAASEKHADAAPDATESLTPPELAKRLLATADDSTDVTVGDDVSVAGRGAYDLVLTPKTTATLVDSVSIAVDAETGVPLRVEVDARGQSEPAISVGFTRFDPSSPAADRFAFTPPAGATVTEKTLPTAKAPVPKAGASRGTTTKPAVTGSGWASIATLPAGTAPDELTSDPLVAQLATAVPGGRALSTSLVSVLITDDGRVLVGAVPVSALSAAAG